MTQDIDFWVRPTRENLLRLALVAQAFVGASFDVDEVLDLLKTSRLGFHLAGLKPNKIEVLLRVSALEPDRAFERAVPTEYKGVAFRVLHPHDQIINKRASNRDKDRADIKNLVKRYGEPQE